jgi:hypothetical protein
MEICILEWDGSRSAEDALKEVTDAQGDRNPWVHDIGMIARPLIGRVRIGVTFPDGQSQTLHEGDLASAVESLGAYTGYYVSSLAGPLSSMFATVNAGLDAGALGAEAEKRLFRLDELKKVLPRNSSALVLIANPETCDAMVRMFDNYSPRVTRLDAADELRKRLQALHRTAAEKMKTLQAEAGGTPATH